MKKIILSLTILLSSNLSFAASEKKTDPLPFKNRDEELKWLHRTFHRLLEEHSNKEPNAEDSKSQQLSAGLKFIPGPDDHLVEIQIIESPTVNNQEQEVDPKIEHKNKMIRDFNRRIQEMLEEKDGTKNSSD